MLLLVCIAAVCSVCVRHIQVRQQKQIQAIVDAGGTVKSRKWFLPIPGAPVESVVIPGSAVRAIETSDLKLFPFLDKVVIEDLSLSGEIAGKPWSFEGSFEADGAPPPLETMASEIVSHIASKKRSAPGGQNGAPASE